MAVLTTNYVKLHIFSRGLNYSGPEGRRFEIAALNFGGSNGIDAQMDIHQTITKMSYKLTLITCRH